MPHELNPLICTALLTAWQKKYQRSSVCRYVGVYRQILRMLEQFGAPAIQLPKVKQGAQRAVVAQGNELALLLGSGKPALRLFILLYLQCGLRRAEAMAVTPRAWNPDEHTVTLRVKGGEFRTAQLTEDVEQLLRAAPHCQPDQSYIEALNGTHISAQGIKIAWDRHKKKLGINPLVTAHDLRRTAATILYSATKDLRVAQQLLGHKNLASTLRYLAPLAPDEARKYSELLRFHQFKPKEGEKTQ